MNRTRSTCWLLTAGLLTLCSCRGAGWSPLAERGAPLPVDPTLELSSRSPAAGLASRDGASGGEGPAPATAVAAPGDSPSQIQRLSFDQPAPGAQPAEAEGASDPLTPRRASLLPERRHLTSSPEGESLAPVVDAPQRPGGAVTQPPMAPSDRAQWRRAEWDGIPAVPPQRAADADAAASAPRVATLPAPGEYLGPPPHWCNPQTCGPQGCGPQGCGPLVNSGPPCGPAGCGPEEYLCGCGLRIHKDDEHVCDGGDTKLSVRVRDDWSVVGLDHTDTVGHYDTLDGRTHVAPSNRVCIYSPRFSAVRQIIGVVAKEGKELAAGANLGLKASSDEHTAWQASLLQPLQPERHSALKNANQLREHNRGLIAAQNEGLVGTRNGYLPYEDFEIIRRGVNVNSEKARLNERALAAQTWMLTQVVQVVIDAEQALPVSSVKGAQATTLYELQGKPRLRICKVASTDNALPGEEVEFTIRFDNVGDQVMGNVTIMDSLTTRLEYVDESESCTVENEFFTQRNEAESLVLRWEIKAPLKVGEGGVIRFKCKVR